MPTASRRKAIAGLRQRIANRKKTIAQRDSAIGLRENAFACPLNTYGIPEDALALHGFAETLTKGLTNVARRCLVAVGFFHGGGEMLAEEEEANLEWRSVTDGLSECPRIGCNGCAKLPKNSCLTANVNCLTKRSNRSTCKSLCRKKECGRSFDELPLRHVRNEMSSNITRCKFKECTARKFKFASNGEKDLPISTRSETFKKI